MSILSYSLHVDSYKSIWLNFAPKNLRNWTKLLDREKVKTFILVLVYTSTAYFKFWTRNQFLHKKGLGDERCLFKKSGVPKFSFARSALLTKKVPFYFCPSWKKNSFAPVSCHAWTSQLLDVFEIIFGAFGKV